MQNLTKKIKNLKKGNTEQQRLSENKKANIK